MTVAALFVAKNGCYYGLDDVDPWDEERDARLYAGPHPVVAHPPCSRWCRLAGLVEARWGHKRGDDGGCFASALASVRRWGGVLEHPAYSDAFPAHGLPRPNRHGGWQASLCGGWVCHVEQARYGHAAKKATWLYAFGTDLPEPPLGQHPRRGCCGARLVVRESRQEHGEETATREEGRALDASSFPRHPPRHGSQREPRRHRPHPRQGRLTMLLVMPQSLMQRRWSGRFVPYRYPAYWRLAPCR